MNNVYLSSILKDARKKSGKTQQQIANLAAISRTYYADIERSRYTPSLIVFFRLAVIFNLDLNGLIRNDELGIANPLSQISNHQRDRQLES